MTPSQSQKLPRVAVDAHVLDGKVQGSATFLANILTAMADMGLPFQVVIYCEEPQKVAARLGTTPFEYRQLPHGGAIGRLLKTYPKLFREDRIDLGLFQYICPPFSKTPSLIVVHDVLPFTHPDLFPPGFRISRQLLFSLSIKIARGIITVSQTAKGEIARLFPAKAGRITVATNGPSHSIENYFSDFPAPLPPNLKPGQPYILAVGRVEKRKNVDLLTRAFLQTRLTDVKLVIVGNLDLGFDWQVPQDDRVMHLTGISDDQLLALHKNASLFVYPSRAEGFGIPLLDALLAAAPVISSDRTSMPEVAGNLAQFFDPTQPDAETVLKEMIEAHFTTKPIPRPTFDERRALAARFDWRQSATNLVSSIETALTESR